jgi:hypothetical protein
MYRLTHDKNQLFTDVGTAIRWLVWELYWEQGGGGDIKGGGNSLEWEDWYTSCGAAVYLLWGCLQISSSSYAFPSPSTFTHTHKHTHTHTHTHTKRGMECHPTYFQNQRFPICTYPQIEFTNRTLHSQPPQTDSHATFTYTTVLFSEQFPIYLNIQSMLMFCTTNTIFDLLPPKIHNTKSNYEKSGLYSLSYSACQSSCVGRTGHSLKQRYSEHMWYIKQIICSEHMLYTSCKMHMTTDHWKIPWLFCNM